MESKSLYQELEQFITTEMSDERAQDMEPIKSYITENFMNRSMGLVCDFADEILRVYTAVFPSEKVLQELIDKDVTNSMLFVHHPMNWDIRLAPDVFQLMDAELLEQLKVRKISIYNLHVPLDDNHEYGTTTVLLEALGLQGEGAIDKYFGADAGAYATSNFDTIEDLKKKFDEVLGHESKLYEYGEKNISGKKIAVIAGGGLTELMEVSAEKGVNIFITGITSLNPFTQESHDIAKEYKIHILGGTHYSTEKFACIKMNYYFQKLGLESEFIDDEPVFEDM